MRQRRASSSVGGDCMGRTGLILGFALGIVVSSSCDENGQGVDGGKCLDVVHECPPGTVPRSIRQAREEDGATEVRVEELGIVDLDTKAFLRKASSSGCEYACVQAITCSPGTKTCFHNGCFACLGESSDYCSNCVEF